MVARETPGSKRPRWTSFVADGNSEDGRRPRQLHQETNPRHRLRVEYNDDTLLIHLSDEDGGAWTTIAIDRTTRRWAVAQSRRQVDAARDAYASLYPE
jgi:hypothetical protein